MTDREYHFSKISKWSKEVKELCNNQCAYCGVQPDGSLDKRIEAHHIKQRALFPELQLALENGIALCHKCHLKAHDGNYQVYLDKRFYGTRLIKKTGPVYDFVEQTFETALFMSETKYGQIAAAAAAAGESVNGYIKKAIDMRMQKE